MQVPEKNRWTVTGSSGFKTDEASGGKFTAPLLDTPRVASLERLAEPSAAVRSAETAGLYRAAMSTQ